MSNQQRQILKLLAARTAIKEEKKASRDGDLSLDAVGLIFMGIILLIPLFIFLAGRLG